MRTEQIIKIIKSKMKIAFFQAAMLVSAASAVDTDKESFFPDLLVQTASIVDFFYPFPQESPAEQLAQITTEVQPEA